MKKSLAFLLLLCILSIASVNAQEDVLTAETTVQTKAYIYITIIDPVPELHNLTITSPVYPYSKVECKAEVIDNLPESVKLNYRWYVNGEFVSEAESLSDREVALEPGQEVRCEVIAYDSIGQASNIVTANTNVQKLTVFGVTSYAVKNLNKTGTGFFAVLIPFIFISMGISLRKRIR